jgi:hypothetical protein
MHRTDGPAFSTDLPAGPVTDPERPAAHPLADGQGVGHTPGPERSAPGWEAAWIDLGGEG